MAARGEPPGANVVRYQLAADRISFVAEERFRSAAMNYDDLWVMERGRVLSRQSPDGTGLR